MATELYLQRAMEYFSKKYGSVQFIVVSDDLSWCRKYLKHHDNVWIPEEEHSEEVDMALLIQCNHTIMSTGKNTLE